MEPTTLCFPIDKEGNILLGRKKRGFGAGKYNGFGGKVQGDETFRTCAVREMAEEVSLLADAASLRPIAFLDFQFPYEPALTHVGYVYLVDTYQGLPLESEEMDPEWFAPTELPYDQMWKGDRAWLPNILAGTCMKGVIIFGEDNDTVERVVLHEVASIDEKDPSVYRKTEEELRQQAQDYLTTGRIFHEP